ncbi:MAG: 4-hydroxythreonine-4-phosphate dehydrogenase, partial [Burkholderia vietnamiensis]|nr:4-hydroxythreonine-4-phosphate dehydrogenase [Burkholderia vietnamiensis]
MTAAALQIAITTGEPAGVGPELTVQALQDAARRWPDAQFTVLGDAALLDARAAAVGADRAVLAGGPVSV